MSHNKTERQSKLSSTFLNSFRFILLFHFLLLLFLTMFVLVMVGIHQTLHLIPVKIMN